MRKQLPAFANESEEADWWFANRERLAHEFIAAGAEGRLRRAGMARRLAEAEKATQVLLGREDALRAARLAAEKGLEVEVYLNELVHKAIMRELEGNAS